MTKSTRNEYWKKVAVGQTRALSPVFADAPDWLKIQRRRGAKREGLLYEKALAEALPEGFIQGQWIHYLTPEGSPKWCQPDFLLKQSRFVVVLEAKLSWRAAAHQQVNFYEGLLRQLTGLPSRGVVVTKVLRPGLKDQAVIVSDLTRAVAVAAAGEPVVFHWLGKGHPLGVAGERTRSNEYAGRTERLTRNAEPARAGRSGRQSAHARKEGAASAVAG